ncbi:hypothetical protein U1Q18_005269 [Sarracenia purpurea var. burkii]
MWQVWPYILVLCVHGWAFVLGFLSLGLCYVFCFGIIANQQQELLEGLDFCFGIIAMPFPGLFLILAINRRTSLKWEGLAFLGMHKLCSCSSIPEGSCFSPLLSVVV